MYAVRLVGTNNWIMRTPGHSKVMANAGSTWSSPPKELETFYNADVRDHVANTSGITYDPKEPKTDERIARLFYTFPEKFLEVVEIKFEAI